MRKKVGPSWSLLLFTVMVNTTLIILGINFMAATTSILLHGGIEGGSAVTVEMRGHTVTDIVTHYDSSMILVLCNDVETNPGPPWLSCAEMHLMKQ